MGKKQETGRPDLAEFKKKLARSMSEVKNVMTADRIDNTVDDMMEMMKPAHRSKHKQPTRPSATNSPPQAWFPTRKRCLPSIVTAHSEPSRSEPSRASQRSTGNPTIASKALATAPNATPTGDE